MVLLRERWRSKLGTRDGGENGGALLQFCVEMVVAPSLLQMEMRWWLARCCRCGGEKMEEDGVVMVSAMVVGKGAGTSMVAAGVAGEGGVRDGAVGVVAGEEMAAAAAMVGGREIRVRVSCVRWRR